MWVSRGYGRGWRLSGRPATTRWPAGRRPGQAGTSARHAGEKGVLEPATQAQRRATAQPHVVIALEQWRERGDLGEVHGRGLVDAHEAFTQLLQQVGERAAHEVVSRGGVHVHVVVVGLEPVDRGSLDQLELLAARYQQALAGACLRTR